MKSKNVHVYRWMCEKMKILLRKIVIIVNIILPLVLGAWIYIVSTEDVFFVRLFTEHMMKMQRLIEVKSDMGIFFRNYFADFLWGYSLMFAIYYVLNETDLRKIYFIVLLFSAFMESLQLFPKLPGTFDFFDILIEGMAELLAAVFIKIMRRHWSYEEQN